MKEAQAVKLYGGITQISEDIIEEAQDARPAKRRRAWVRWAAAAACLCIVAAGALVWRQASAPGTVEGSGITVTEDGVTIPPRQVTLAVPIGTEPCWAYRFFIYQGHCYVEYERIAHPGDLIGEHLGRTTGLLEVWQWSSGDGYVDLAGNFEGDFYAVQGYDPADLLCTKNEDGSVSIFICDSGITLKTGYDLYEARLHLTESYTAVQYETRASWYSGAGEIQQLLDPAGEIVTEFLAALNAAPFLPTAEIPLDEGETSVSDDKEIYHLYFLLENGMTVHLRLLKGGYVRFQGLWDVCVQVPAGEFDAMIALFSQPGAAAPAEREDDSVSLEDCAGDENLGAFVPGYIPDGMSLQRAGITYDLDPATAAETGTREIRMEFSDGKPSGSSYDLTITWAHRYGLNGWAGPMLEVSELSEGALAEFVQTESAGGRPLTRSRIQVGVWYGDVSVVLSGDGLDARTAYQILASVEGQ